MFIHRLQEMQQVCGKAGTGEGGMYGDMIKVQHSPVRLLCNILRGKFVHPRSSASFERSLALG